MALPAARSPVPNNAPVIGPERPSAVCKGAAFTADLKPISGSVRSALNAR
jgi:hypothetical protein